jgi:septal ring factor EnvC (AmiA/AmiB activator)
MGGTHPDRRRSTASVVMTACTVMALIVPGVFAGEAGAQSGQTTTTKPATTTKPTTTKPASTPTTTKSTAAKPTTTKPAAPSTTKPAKKQTTTTTVKKRPSTTTTTAPPKVLADREVESLRDSLSGVNAEVAVIDERLAEQTAELMAAQAEADAAAEVARAARQRVAEARERAVRAREDVAAYAVGAFIRPPAMESLAVMSIARADDAAYASDVLRIMADERRRVVGVLQQAERTAAGEQTTAETAEGAARERAAGADGRRAELERTRGEQQALAARLDGRLENALAEAAALAEIDARAAEELAAQELALRQAGPATNPAVVRAAPAPRPAPAVPRAAAGATPAAPPPTTTRAPSQPSPTTTAPRPATGLPAGTVTWNDVTRVGGIWVHTSIAGNVRALLDAATASGIRLTGGGFRDPASQIALRQAHCGPTAYDIYQKPSSQCTPPTAPPGRSMHERGLAIDFQYNGALITSRSNPGYQWLAANASRFGFFNLPSEPWHWSTNGQ